MEALHQKHCETCQLGAPVVTEEEANKLILAIPAWKKEFHDGVEKLTREFHFVEFRDAFRFSYKIAALAERENQHPTITTAWGKVTVYW